MTLDGQGGDEVIGGYPQQLSPFLTQLVRSGPRSRVGARDARVRRRRVARRVRDDGAARRVCGRFPARVQRPLQQAKALRRYPDWLNGRAEVAPRFASSLATRRPRRQVRRRRCSTT